MVHAYESSKLYWLEMIGQGYHPSIMECPKPLFVFIAGIFPLWMWSILSVAAIIGIAICLVKLSKHYTKSTMPGVVAMGLFLFTNKVVLGEIFLDQPLFYITFSLAALLFYVENRFMKCAVCLVIAGLARPEVWLLSSIFVIAHTFSLTEGYGGSWINRLLTAWHYRRNGVLTSFLPLMAPIAWMIFDLVLSRGQDAFYSSHVASNYFAMAGIFPTHISRYMFVVSGYLSDWFYIWPVTVGFLLAGSFFIGNKGMVPLGVYALAPVLFYAIGATNSSYFLYPRFFMPTALMLYFFLTMGVYLAFKRKMVVILYACLILSFGAAPIAEIYAGVMGNASRRATAVQVAEYLNRHMPHGRILVGDSIDILSLQCGVQISRQIHNFKECYGDLSRVKEGDTIIWIDNDTNLSGMVFEFFGRGKTQTFLGKNYELVARVGDGFIYIVK